MEEKPRTKRKKALASDSNKKTRERPSKTKSIQEKKEQQAKILAVVRVRGCVNVRKEIADTLLMLRLDRVNHCVLVPKNSNFEGMLKKVQHYITWGEIERETLEKMIAKRGRFAGDRRITDQNYVKELAELILSGKKLSELGIKPVFRLSPPSKGYESTKTLYPKGSLGYRGEKINELLKRMI